MRLAPAIAICACVVAEVAAQDQRPIFRATTRLVEVSVVVHDRDGRPLAGLTANDFKISEDGKPQTIELFSVQDDRQPETVLINPGGNPSFSVPSVRSSMAPPPARTDFSNWRE